VTTVQDLIDLVELQPWNQTFADLLHEYLTFDCDMTWAEALKHVEQVRQPALRKWQLFQASCHLSPKSKVSGRLRARMAAALDVSVGFSEPIVLVEGGSAPKLTPVPDGVPDQYWSTAIVAVGAVWVLDTVAQIRTDWEVSQSVPTTRKARRRRRGGKRH